MCASVGASSWRGVFAGMSVVCLAELAICGGFAPALLIQQFSEFLHLASAAICE
jgi:hypothetical protein